MGINVKKAVAVAAVFFLASVVVLMILKNPFQKKNITDFEIVTVRESDMRAVREYEIVRVGDESTLSVYSISYIEDSGRQLEKSAVLGADEVIGRLNEFGLIGWDGFRGAHPKNVSDGTMFTLNAVVNGGEKISASGSENFPRHYLDFVRWMRETLYQAQP